MLPIRLYREIDGRVEEVEDNRVRLLNDDTGDTLDAFQMKKALIKDYLVKGNGYIYINRKRNEVKSLHYVDSDQVSAKVNFNPIFKDGDFIVQGQTYRSFDFIKVLRDTKDGLTGTSIASEMREVLAVAYNTITFEKFLVKNGGNKKGYIKANKKLTKEALDELKTRWRELYSNSQENCLILNEGLDFGEISNTSVEMQLAENKKINAKDIASIFNLSEAALTSETNNEGYVSFIKTCIIPLLTMLETAFNKELLLNSEQGSFYFAFDTKELLKADIKERFEAYQIASQNGFMQTDEIRYREDLEPLGLNFIKLGLQDVLYDVDKKTIYTPNTGLSQNLDELGGEIDENRGKEQ